MKVLLAVSSMGAGGAERVAATLSNAWVARGYAVTLLVTYSKRGTCSYWLDPQVELIYLSDVASANPAKNVGKTRRLLSFRKLIRQQKPTVVVSFLTNVNVATIVATVGLGVPVVVAERSYPPQMPLGASLHWLRQATYPFATKIVMLTQLGAQWVEANILSAQASVIPNPITFPLPDSSPSLNPANYLAHDRKFLMAVGRLAPEKQLDHLFRAFSSLATTNPDWDIVLVGEGPMFDELQTLVKTLRLERRVIFVGRAGNVGDWYSRADLYVLCSRFEGFPNSLAEAMTYGCAVISYDCDTGPRDIINPGIDGVLVPPGDEKALAAEISALMADDNRRARFAVAAAESVQKRFALSEILNKWDSVFQHCSARARKTIVI